MRNSIFTLAMMSAAMAGGGAASAREPQTTKGIITGRVTDTTGAVLQGAQIQLQPKGVTVASDVQGEFTIPDLEAGDYKLAVSYLGFKEFDADLKLGAGENKKYRGEAGSGERCATGPGNGRSAARRSRGDQPDADGG